MSEQPVREVVERQPGRRESDEPPAPSRVGNWVFSRLAKWVDRSGPGRSGRGAVTPVVDDETAARDFAIDADLALHYQDPVRARLAIRLSLLILVVLVVWASVAELDELTKGEGKVIPSRQIQVIQSLDGGIVSEILVKEGQTVQQGETLLKIDETRFVSNFKESRATYLASLAKAARLRAIAEGSAFVAPPEVVRESPALAQQENALYLSRKAELEAQIAIARQQSAQRSHEFTEARSRRDQAAQSFDLAARELAMTKPLVASGAVSDVDLLRLERDVTRFRGERDQAAVQMVRLQSAIAEASRKIEEAELQFRNAARAELAETQGKINSLSEGSVALSDKVKQSAIKSPVHGTIKRLFVNTVGGVVQPGKDIIEIVPLEDALLLEARVLPKDIAFLRPGQQANVKFTAYDYAIYGGLEAKLEHISADSVLDDKGNAFFLVRVRTSRPSLGPNLPIIPGMVAEVDILTGKKTVLSYLLKPVLRAKQYALTER